VAIYGANASGKSNVIKALKTMREIVINSSRSGQVSDRLPIEPYLLNTETIDKPSGFEVIVLIGGVRYRYGFEATKDEVLSEWLFYVPKSRETRLFERNGKIFHMSEKFRLMSKGLEGSTRKNALFISVLSQFNNEIAGSILSWFEKMKFIQAEAVANVSDQSRTILSDKSLRESIADLLVSFDIGINGLDYEEVDFISDERFKNVPDSTKEFLRNSGFSKGGLVKTRHKQYSGDGREIGYINFDLDVNESDGTKKLFSILPAIMAASAGEGIAVIDELDSRLHPTITKMILSLFNNSESNISSQLIFTTHDTNLLTKENFRRDQVWFVEKSKAGESDLYSLAEMQVRNDSNYSKDYLRGRYGAVPYINTKNILGNING
jgi:uncharacterized protein